MLAWICHITSVWLLIERWLSADSGLPIQNSQLEFWNATPWHLVNQKTDETLSTSRPRDDYVIRTLTGHVDGWPSRPSVCSGRPLLWTPGTGGARRPEWWRWWNSWWRQWGWERAYRERRERIGAGPEECSCLVSAIGGRMGVGGESQWVDQMRGGKKLCLWWVLHIIHMDIYMYTYRYIYVCIYVHNVSTYTIAYVCQEMNKIQPTCT